MTKHTTLTESLLRNGGLLLLICAQHTAECGCHAFTVACDEVGETIVDIVAEYAIPRARTLAPAQWVM